MKTLLEFLVKGKIENNYETVDLDLPSHTLWATCNIGAKNPEDSGDYYSWGETEIKDNYSWETYKYGTRDNITKYNSEQILKEQDDIAFIKSKGMLHMPTTDELNELRNNTKITKVNNAYKFTSLKDEHKFIIIPCAGKYWKGKIMDENDNIYLWSSNCYGDSAEALSIDSHGSRNIKYYYKYTGLSVRGVL